MNAFDFAEKGISFNIKLGPVKRKTSSCFYFRTTIAKWIQSILKAMFKLVFW